MDTLFKPQPQFEEIGLKLQRGEHFGPHGALADANSYIAPHANAGDIASMMQMANVYYTLVGSVGTKAGFKNKLRAAQFLHAAKLWATEAFLAQFKTKDLHSAIRLVDVYLNADRRIDLGHGDVHILMSCYVQWAAQVKRRLHLPTGHEYEIAKSCYTAIKHCYHHNLQVLAASTMLSFPELSDEIEEKYTHVLHDFLREHLGRLIHETDVDSVDRGLVQTVCRAARTLQEFDAAIQLAEKYGMGDQAEKARNRH